MTLRALYTIFRSNPEWSWIMEPQNAQILYDFIKKHPIKKVLDLGTGIGASAAVCALALKDKGEIDFHVDTIEQSDKCIKLAKELIPQELQEHVTFHKSEVITWETSQIPHQTFSVYKTLPEGEWDLIINDGPGGFLKDGQFIDLPNSTITELLLKNRLSPGTFIIWDGRQHMLRILERYYSDNFWLVRPNQQSDDMNILERKDNPVLFNDSIFEAYKNSTYFSKSV